MSRLMMIVGFVAVVSTAARADWREDQERERKQEMAERIRAGLEQLGRDLPQPGIEPGAATAPLRAPGWCRPADREGTFQPSLIAMKIRPSNNPGASDIVKAAEMLCPGDPRDPIVQRAAAVVEQMWLNRYGGSDADAVASLAARIDRDAYAAAKTKLCESLKVTDEATAEAKAFADWRLTLFCDPPAMAASVVPFLDTAAEPDPLVELGYVSSQLAMIEGSIARDREAMAVRYALLRYDLPRLSPDRIAKSLEAEPYRSPYAQTVAREALGAMTLRGVRVAAAIEALTKDADWRELLVTAPDRGVAAWTEKAATWKDAIARSNAVERALTGDSRKAVEGCEAPLRADFLALLRSLKHGTETELDAELADSAVGGLLLSRLAACVDVTGDYRVAGIYDRVLPHVRVVRGPRTMAFFAMLDALAKIHDDRPKFPVGENAMARLRVTDHQIATALPNRKKRGSAMPFEAPDEAVIATATKGATTTRLTFPTQKFQVMDYDCHETNRIDSISGGTIIYRQACKEKGWVWRTATKHPVEIANEHAGGLKAGMSVKLATSADEKEAMTIAASAGKKLVNYLGFAL